MRPFRPHLFPARWPSPWLPLVVLLLADVARANDGVSVYVNEVNVDGLTNQNFDKVNVRIDEKGNVHIEAPGYAVKRLESKEMKPPPAPEATITKKYFLVTEQNGATGYDIDVFLNGKFLRTLASGEPQVIIDLTRQLKAGKNQVLVQAKKRVAAKEDAKGAPPHVFRVIVGEGVANDAQVIIEKQLVTFTRAAVETNDVTQEFAFTTR